MYLNYHQCETIDLVTLDAYDYDIYFKQDVFYNRFCQFYYKKIRW